MGNQGLVTFRDTNEKESSFVLLRQYFILRIILDICLILPIIIYFKMIYWKWSTVPVADLVQPLVQKKTLPQALDWSWQQPAAPGWASPLDLTKFGLKHKEIFQRRVFWICTSSLSSNWGEEGLCPWTSIFLVDGTFLIWRPKKLVPLWLLRQLSLSKIKVENRDGNSPTGNACSEKAVIEQSDLQVLVDPLRSISIFTFS